MFLFDAMPPNFFGRQKNSQVIITSEKGALQLCSEHTLSPFLRLILECVARPDLCLRRNTTDNLKSNRYLYRKYVLCGFLVPTAFRPQSS